MAAVDTSVLVRIITRDHPGQRVEALTFLEGLGREGAFVPPLVLAETTWVLERAYRWRPADILKALQITAHCGSFRMEDTCLSAIELFRREHASGIGFSDCLILQTVKDKNQGPLATFDRRLATLSGTHTLGGGA